MMRRVAISAIASTVALVFLSLWSSTDAFAAHRCKPAVLDDGSVIRVATLRTPCRLGRGIAETYFERVQQGEGYDGKTREGAIYYAVKGFRCLTGLGGTQAYCHRHRRWVFASSRIEDHPSTWTPSYRRSRAAVAAQVQRCKDVMFIGARGSGEPASERKDGKEIPYERGMGKPVNHMATRLGKAVDAYGEEMGVLPVNYTADSVSELVPSRGEIAAMAASGVLGIGNPGAGVAGLTGAAALYYVHHARPYLASIKDGVRRTIEAVRAQLALCPESELVLAGYSQGAMAVHQAELQLQREGKEDLLDAIGGTLLLGDGDRVPHSAAKLIGGAPSGGQGVQVALHGFKPGDVVEPETTVEICVAGDIVCDFKLRTDVGAFSAYRSGAHLHSGYNDKPQRDYLDQAVDWLAREMGLDPFARSARAGRSRGGPSPARGASALASSFRACGPLGYAPKNGGYSLIIGDRRVQRIGCARAARIGGAYLAGDPVPVDWRCQQDVRTACRYRHSRRRLNFIFEGDAGRAVRPAEASSRRLTISFRGIGGLRWGAKVPKVEERLGVSFDCSEGLVPGRCLCPPSEPDLSIRFVFDAQGPRQARLQAFFAGGPAHTPRGIALGSSKRAVERAYPGARYEVNAALDSGLSTFLVARHNGHALVFSLRNGRVSSILAYAHGGSDYIASEQCA